MCSVRNAYVPGNHHTAIISPISITRWQHLFRNTPSSMVSGYNTGRVGLVTILLSCQIAFHIALSLSLSLSLSHTHTLGHVYVVYEDTNLYNDMGMT